MDLKLGDHISAEKSKIRDAIEKIRQGIDDLRDIYSDYDKEFTIDGRLVGDIGEVLAAEYYQISLNRKQEPSYDGFTRIGNESTERRVEIKATFKDRYLISEAVENHHETQLLLALKINTEHPEGFTEVFNGLISTLPNYDNWKSKKKVITVKKLQELNKNQAYKIPRR